MGIFLPLDPDKSYFDRDVMDIEMIHENEIEFLVTRYDCPSCVSSFAQPNLLGLSDPSRLLGGIVTQGRSMLNCSTTCVDRFPFRRVMIRAAT